MPPSQHLSFDITCWYINQRRVAELVPAFEPVELLGLAPELPRAKRQIVQWLRRTPVLTLGQLFSTNTRLAEGTLFTHHADFYCRGLAAFKRSKSPHPPLPEVYSKLNTLRDGLSISFSYHPEHLVSSSAHSKLQGHARLFVLGAVSSVQRGKISALPFLMGTPILSPPETQADTITWSNYHEVWPVAIDQFEKAAAEEIPQGPVPPQEN